MEAFSKQEFIDLYMMNCAEEFIAQSSSDLHFRASKVVAEYVATKTAHGKRDNLVIDFRGGEDGMLVSYEYEYGGWGAEYETKTAIFRLKYRDVFGWEVDWSKPLSGRVLDKLILSILDKNKIKPEPIDYQI